MRILCDTSGVLYDENEMSYVIQVKCYVTPFSMELANDSFTKD